MTLDFGKPMDPFNAVESKADMLFCANSVIHKRKELCVSRKELCMSRKELCMSRKELYVGGKELCMGRIYSAWAERTLWRKNYIAEELGSGRTLQRKDSATEELCVGGFCVSRERETIDLSHALLAEV